MAMKELKAIDVMSLATLSAVIAAIWGFLGGLIAALSAGMLPLVMESVMPAASMGFAAIIMFPIGAAIMGFVMGAITAFVYNIVAERVGGIKLDI